MTTRRVGFVLGVKDSNVHAPLKWDEVTSVVRKGERENDLEITFRTPNGKTEESGDLPITLHRVHTLLLDPVIWYLVLATRMGAIAH